MTEIIKLAAIFIFCNGAGCNCSNNPNGGTLDTGQLCMGMFAYALAVLIERFEDRNDKN